MLHLKFPFMDVVISIWQPGLPAGVLAEEEFHCLWLFLGAAAEEPEATLETDGGREGGALELGCAHRQ